MKKILIALLVTIIPLFTSCSSEESKLFSNVFKSDSTIANETFQKIINGINIRDGSAIREMFSDKALREAIEFDEKLASLFDYCEGEMLSYNAGGPGVFQEKNADGRGFIKKEIQSTYDVETSKKKYHIAIREFIQDTECSDNVGIYSIYVVATDSLDEPVADWWMEDGVWIPGVTIGDKRK